MSLAALLLSIMSFALSRYFLSCGYDGKNVPAESNCLKIIPFYSSINSGFSYTLTNVLSKYTDGISDHIL